MVSLNLKMAEFVENKTVPELKEIANQLLDALTIVVHKIEQVSREQGDNDD